MGKIQTMLQEFSDKFPEKAKNFLQTINKYEDDYFVDLLTIAITLQKSDKEIGELSEEYMNERLDDPSFKLDYID